MKIALLTAALLPALLFPLLAESKRSANPPATENFSAAANERLGPAGGRAAEFLWAGMPAADRRTLDEDFLLENLDLAFRAREEFPWAKSVPEEIFFNDVLPYAVFDEPRDRWRKDLHQKCRELVKGCRTATEAAQALNRDFFNLVRVHYDTGRKRTNQSPSESIAQGKATCTGLAILLVDACRSVGVPARAAGIREWPMKEGNHTWAEIWDGEWKFTGADEYEPDGLNRAWFVEDASHAIAGTPAHAIFATSWRPAGITFPMAWSDAATVAAVNVTDRYTKLAVSSARVAEVSVRVLAADAGGDGRLVARVELRDEAGKIVSSGRTKAGRADRNDMPKFSVEAGRKYSWRVARDGETREAPLEISEATPVTIDLRWDELARGSKAVEAVESWLARPFDQRGAPPELALSRVEAERARDLLWLDRRERLRAERADDLRAKKLTHGDFVMRIREKTFGAEPAGGHSLWISLHGGGGVPAGINDDQWKNQVDLYRLGEGICVAPRSPTDAWNMWHQDHMDPLIDRLIEDFIAIRGVNPDRVYLVGYSAGGDGVYQLGPRLADRLAGAGMMAGHPNDSSPLSLRNLPFAILVGGDDAAYDRNKKAAEWGEALDDLRKNDARGYEHFLRIYPGLGHWMNRRDAEAIPWLASFTRTPWPRRVVWEQGNVPARRFYWLSRPGPAPKKGDLVEAEVEGQTIRVRAKSARGLTLRLSDELLDLDRPVTVEANGKEVFSGQVARRVSALAASMEERGDPRSSASAELAVTW